MTTANPERSGAPAASPDRYLERIGFDPNDADFDADGSGTADSGTADRETLARLQRAHVTTVPFETLAITGDPYGPREGRGVSLALSDLFEKIVERQRGGYCFELNGLFGWLLEELGFDADRIAARVVSGGSEPTTPASHHAHVVRLDRRYLVDVGFGPPIPRRPIPLDGTVVRDDAGVEWRVVESQRPDAEYLCQGRAPGAEGGDGDEAGDAWADKYVFDATPRSLDYFAATCEYFATAPESPFTGDPVAVIATDEGHLKLKPERLTRYERGEETEREIDESAWYELLAAEFGLDLGST